MDKQMNSGVIRSRLSLGKAVEEAIAHYNRIGLDPMTQDVSLAALVVRGAEVLTECSEANPSPATSADRSNQ